jgi:glycosyltransferase involved in cell wall biosynthesis
MRASVAELERRENAPASTGLKGRERMRGRAALVSVIVPARNASRTLQQQLDAIAEQDYTDRFEIVIAMNGGRDGTAEVAARWINRRGLGRLVDASARRGPGYARNRGADAARGDFLAFCDADDVVSRGWLRALVAGAEQADVVTGPHSLDLLNDPVIRSCQSVPPLGKPLHAFLPFASTSNCGVWRDVFDAVGGFDEQRYSAGEDVAFSWRAQLSGFSLLVAEEAVVHKRFRPRRLAIAPQYFRYGIGDAWLYSQFGPAGMPRRSLREAFQEWRAIVRGVLSLAGTAGRLGRVVQMAALDCGRIAGSVRYRVLFP